jgi:hypothetical protein
MSLHHEESDKVFPRLYLPIMAEAHRRVLARWRQLMPWTAAWWRHRANIAQLDGYLHALVRRRWQALTGTERCAGCMCLPACMLTTRMRALS